MATPSGTDSLIDQAKCFKCIPDGAQMQVQTYLLDQLRNSLTAGWDDLVFNPAVLTAGPGTARQGQVIAASNPGGDQLAMRLTLNTADMFWITVQMPHTWVPGTHVHPHIHVVEQSVNANNCVFSLNYSISDINGTFPVNTTVNNMAASIPAGSQFKHLLFDLPDGGINMSAFRGPSTILRMHYTLTGGGPVDVISFDLHIFKSISPVAFEP